MKKISAFLLLAGVLFTKSITAQDRRGYIYDKASKEPITGAQVYNAVEERYAIADENGGFIYPVSRFPARLKISGMGYQTLLLNAGSAKELQDTIFLQSEGVALGQVVVSASKNKQRIEEVTQSIELVKPDLLKNTQTVEVQEVMEKIPGLVVQKDQVTIRGTSGFSYGAGSRILVLLDDMPILSADAGDAKWTYYPIENLSQMEVMKGASSALYGASALEGIIHLQTANATDSPYTQARIFEGVYDPKHKEMESTYRFGGTLAHREKIGNLGIVSSVTGVLDQGYRKQEEDQIIRGNLSLQYKPKKSDKWLFGGSINGYVDDGINFLLFGDVAKPYEPLAGTTSDFKNKRWHADLSVRYYQTPKVRHILRGRLFNTINNNNTGQSSHGEMLFREYQFQGKLVDRPKLATTLTAGVNSIRTSTKSEKLYGTHQGRNLALYLQADQKISRLNITLGGRLEAFDNNGSDTLTIFPVFRSGANLRLLKGTFLRASAGQGVRYPSVAELYGATSSGIIKIFPNPNLVPEIGFSMEAGIRQVLPFNRFKGYVDVAAFQGTYVDMIEYTFGNYAPPGTPIGQILNYLGFKPQNMKATRIRGIEASTGFMFTLNKKTEIDFYGGYTYVDPKDRTYTGKVEREKYLRYRRQHLVRGNLDITYSRFGFGVYTVFNSSIKNMDVFFIDAIKGLKKDDYWIKYSEGFITDLRLSYKLSSTIDLSFFCHNILNDEYMEAPGNSNAPRQFVVQANFQF